MKRMAERKKGGGAGLRFRYEELPEAWRRQVDALDGCAAPGPAPVPEAKTRPGPNKTEAAYHSEVLARRADLVSCRFEAVTFRMANGHRYTPDWLCVSGSGALECHEVKGGYALPSQQRARLAFDQVRVEFPSFRWVWAVRAGHGWSTEVG